jgi:predicted Zn finger-like uncharacterized protein
MIVSCPSCATRYEMPDQHLGAEGMAVRCRACGYRWVEGRAVQVIDVSPAPALARYSESDREAERLVEAAQLAREAFIANRRRSIAERRGWACFAAALIIPIIFLAFYPDIVVRAAPAAASLYEKAGIKVNIYGLEVRRVQQEHVIVDGIRVLAIKGEIVNVSNVDRKIPALRFGLRSPAEGELYAWTVESAVRPLRPGETTGFSTRVASPPEAAQKVEIRFARLDEIGSNVAP